MVTRWNVLYLSLCVHSDVGGGEEGGSADSEPKDGGPQPQPAIITTCLNGKVCVRVCVYVSSTILNDNPYVLVHVWIHFCVYSLCCAFRWFGVVTCVYLSEHHLTPWDWNHANPFGMNSLEKLIHYLMYKYIHTWIWPWLPSVIASL